MYIYICNQNSITLTSEINILLRESMLMPAHAFIGREFDDFWKVDQRHGYENTALVGNLVVVRTL